MCGIFVIFPPAGQRLTVEQIRVLRGVGIKQSRLLRHRGPDWSGIYTGPTAIVCHERLALVDPFSGAQPIYSSEGHEAVKDEEDEDIKVRKLREGARYVLAVNGEIYNHKEIRAEYKNYHFLTGSDCEALVPLYAEFVENEQFGVAEMMNRLNGMYGFSIVDTQTGGFFVSRDPIGVIPLYYGTDKEGKLYIASEMKSLIEVCNATLNVFPPGHYFDHHMFAAGEGPTRWFKRDWESYHAIENGSSTAADLRKELGLAVHRQLMCDAPYGVLLSGGLDSSVISALAAAMAAKRVESGDKDPAWYPTLHSFAIGLRGAPDLAAAACVAEKLGTVHHELHFTVQEGIDALSDVVYHIETYDVTTIRASTPMFLMARKIKAMGIKMVLSGEGADEIFGGYLYFHKAPNTQEFHEENVRKLSKLHQFDCARANKALAAWGVEGRVPFLDRDFLDTAMRIPPREKFINVKGENKKRAIEKGILREACEDLLPQEIAWRQKEQFSDGVGYSWIDSLKVYAERQVTDEEFAQAAALFPYNTPTTKEGFMYRSIYDAFFPGENAAKCVPGGKSVACSTEAALAWDEAFRKQGAADPSGRAVHSVHNQAYTPVL